MYFTSFSCLIAMAGTSNTKWNKSDKMGILALFLDLKELSIVCGGFVIYDLNYVEVCPSVHELRVLIISGY